MPCVCVCVCDVATLKMVVVVAVDVDVVVLICDCHGWRQGHARYRKILYASTPPAIPFLGVVLNDLTYVDEAFPDVLNTGPTTAHKDRVIHFTKHNLVFDILEDWRHCIDLDYHFREVCIVR